MNTFANCDVINITVRQLAERKEVLFQSNDQF